MVTATTAYEGRTPQTPEFTKYYFGGAYEVRANGDTLKYYSFGGASVMRDDGGELHYMVSTGSTRRLTDHASTGSAQVWVL